MAGYVRLQRAHSAWRVDRTTVLLPFLRRYWWSGTPCTVECQLQWLHVSQTSWGIRGRHSPRRISAQRPRIGVTLRSRPIARFRIASAGTVAAKSQGRDFALRNKSPISVRPIYLGPKCAAKEIGMIDKRFVPIPSPIPREAEADEQERLPRNRDAARCGAMLPYEPPMIWTLHPSDTGLPPGVFEEWGGECLSHRSETHRDRRHLFHVQSRWRVTRWLRSLRAWLDNSSLRHPRPARRG